MDSERRGHELAAARPAWPPGTRAFLPARGYPFRVDAGETPALPGVRRATRFNRWFTGSISMQDRGTSRGHAGMQFDLFDRSWSSVLFDLLDEEGLGDRIGSGGRFPVFDRFVTGAPERFVNVLGRHGKSSSASVVDIIPQRSSPIGGSMFLRFDILHRDVCHTRG